MFYVKDMAIEFPDISPVAFEVGSFQVRWYALAYVFGMMLALFHIRRNDYKKLLSEPLSEDLLLIATIGILVGGRLGYVIIYNFSYYIDNPIEIIKIWNGGMSFFGAIIGLIVVIHVFCKRHSLSSLYIADLVSVSSGYGIFMGRIANFVNQELVGRVTNKPWGVIFPEYDSLPRHPSQIYEAVFEGLLMFLVTNLLYRRDAIKKNEGSVFFVSCIFYSTARFFIEFFREPDVQIGYLLFGLTMGQLLLVFSFFFGFFGLFFLVRR